MASIEISDPISAILGIGGKIIDKIWPDPAQADQAKLALIKLQQEGALQEIAGQMKINETEAANPNVFVSGWRPFVGWVCGVGLATQFLIAPLATWGAALYGKTVIFPPLDMGTLLALLGGMLCIGGMRTVEKINGVAAK